MRTLDTPPDSDSELNWGTLPLGTPNPAHSVPLGQVQKAEAEGWPTAPTH